MFSLLNRVQEKPETHKSMFPGSFNAGQVLEVSRARQETYLRKAGDGKWEIYIPGDLADQAHIYFRHFHELALSSKEGEKGLGCLPDVMQRSIWLKEHRNGWLTEFEKFAWSQDISWMTTFLVLSICFMTLR